jgi:hypothetical protein
MKDLTAIDYKFGVWCMPQMIFSRMELIIVPIRYGSVGLIQAIYA